mmetsp:Transcript_8910/g.21332  ORF Transcript_8910/g.21332 Transcript_8910/m.21332 type:complete len:822 (+) Transcript_8910:53-2518(+)
MDEDAAFGGIRGTARGVYVERPNKPGKVFKLRDVRTSKDWPPPSKEWPGGSKDWPGASKEGRQSRDPSPLPTPGTSPYRSVGRETPASARAGERSPMRFVADAVPSEHYHRSHHAVPSEHHHHSHPNNRSHQSSYHDMMMQRSCDSEATYRRHRYVESRQSSHDSLRWSASRENRRPSHSLEDVRGSTAHSVTQSNFLRRPSDDLYGGVSSMTSQEFGRKPAAFAPSDSGSGDFRSWLNSVLEAEREVVLEVMKGRHAEILSQVNFKMDGTLERPEAPKPLRVTAVPSPAAQSRLQPPQLPGVLVVREDWATGSKDSGVEPENRKKVSLTDDTDAKSIGGDEMPVAKFSSLPAERSIGFLEPDLRKSKSAGSLTGRDDASKSKGAISIASSRMTQTIPHLRKNSLLEGLMELPFWHPGRYVHTTQFDAIFCGVILANTVAMAFQMQYAGIQRGYELGAEAFTMPAGEYWPQAQVIFEFLDWIFGITYFAELVIKLVGMKRRFFQEWWNWFDGLLVIMWLVEVVLASVIPLTDTPILRMMRMARLLRLIRLVKTIQGFDALYIMTTAMQGSATCLFWSFMLLTTVQVMIAFFLNESLEPYYQDASKPVSEKLEVFEYFGTTARVMLTMFELTLANWPTAARILQENVTEYYSLFSVAYKLIVGFAAVGIINGVFMQETFKVAASDDKLMMRQKERDRSLHTKKMRTLFAAADESGDGFIDREEFCDIMNIPEVRTWLAAQELPVRDPNILFSLLDDGDAELTADELVKGVERLKGTAKGIDLAAFIAEYRSFATKVAEKMDFKLEFPQPKSEDEEDDGEEDD